MKTTTKGSIIVILLAAVAAVVAIKQNQAASRQSVSEELLQDQTTGPTSPNHKENPSPTAAAEIPQMVQVRPRLVDLGANKCVPCIMMKPILEELKQDYKDKLEVLFIDVWENPSKAKEYKINLIPTQIFYDDDGKELFRHEGFFSKEDILTKWKEFGFDFTNEGAKTAFERLEPVKLDTRPKEQICYMCDKAVQPKTLVVVQTDKGPVRLCSPHCYFILYSCLTEDKTGLEQKVMFTDWLSGKAIAASDAVFLSGQEEKTGRPWIKAFSDRAQAVEERAASGGSILSLQALQDRELSHRCGFCDRACYPQDAARILVEGGLRTWGCCSHCALGVAARTGKDIEVHEKDRLTGEKIVVKTFDGAIASLEPRTAVAWFGQRKKPDGSWASAGCFHQGFFVSEDNLKVWVGKNPYETGRMISISQALADKMKLTPEQIKKACKIGECVPK
ncbi:MAG: hypothetical protein JXA82_17550 [Sedimentisphaerales bacterium]|nr:hypothetical protein [Sedimentisphaerales bacterium]